MISEVSPIKIISYEKDSFARNLKRTLNFCLYEVVLCFEQQQTFLRSFHIYYNDSPLDFPSVKRGKVWPNLDNHGVRAWYNNNPQNYM